MSQRPAPQLGALVVGSVLRIVLFTQFWTALFTRGTDPVTPGEELARGPAVVVLVFLGVIEVTLLALTWRNPDGTASGVLVVLSFLTALGSFIYGQPAVGAGYLVAGLCFLVAPWFKPGAE
jgi:hypothetical protein